MAFQFVPPFEEGDKQTNPETRVEYIFTDGAWRPLGPKIEDQFDELDERYVNVDGDTIHGTLKFDHGEDNPANLLIRPNISDTATSIYALNNGALRFRSLPAEDTTANSTTHFAMGKTGDSGEPETYIYHLQDPQDELWAANKRYVDTAIADADVDLSGYLPLTGGTLTGSLYLDNKRIEILDSNGEPSFYAQGSGFCKSYDMFRVERAIDGPAFQARIDSTVNAEIRTNGNAFFKGTVNMNSNKIINVLTPTTANDAANKQYVDNHRAIARNGTETNPTLSTGMLYYNTSTKQLFIGE